MAELGPVLPRERVAVLDVLRGWALLGVLVVNVHEVLDGRRYAPQPADTTSLDVAATRFIEIALSGKSITLLTFLFGLGFSIQLVRAGERGEDAAGLFLRRLAALFVIGACHATFLWWGDVTWTYALVGVALLAFRRTGPRALLAWAIALIFVPRLVMTVPVIGAAVRGALPHPADPAAFSAHMLAAVLGHDYPARMSAHLHQVLYWVSPIAAWYLPWLLGRFLLGLYAGKRGLFDEDGAAHLPLFRRLLAWGGALGVAGSAVLWARGTASGSGVSLSARLAFFVVGELTWLGLTAAYASAIVLLIQRPAWRRRLLVLAPVGRMPLTTYLSQSAATTFVFYGWGLGLTGQLGSAACLALTFGIFALQIAVSHLWLRRFRFGPAEWLWRTLVYRRLQPMRPATGERLT